MATASTFDTRIQFLDALISVDPRGEELECRLEGSWPTDLAVEKQELQTNIGHAIDAENRIIGDASEVENVQHWERASDHLHYSLGILIRHKEAIPQELMLWLIKRICVPLAFISQFRLRDLNRAYKALNFFLQFIWFTYDYGNRGPNVLQVMLQNRVEDMTASVPYEYAMLLRTQEGAGGVNSTELDVSSKLYAGFELLLSEACTQADLKARCCELLCVQYYRLGLIGYVWFWLSEWKSSLECISDSITKEFQKRDCLIVEANLHAEYGTDDKKAHDLIRDLGKLSHELQINIKGIIDDPDEKKVKSLEKQMQINHVIGKLRLIGRSGDARSREDIESQAKMDVENMDAQVGLLEEAMKGQGLRPDNTLRALNRKSKKAMDSARHEVAIRYLEMMVDHVNSMPLYINTPSRIASALAKLLYDQASCHVCLFHQKELKFFMDSMKKNCSNSDEHSSCFSSASLKLCTHHCWSPYCQHGSHHGCPEEDEEDEDEVDILELADLGHHEYESPIEFYTKRHIESDGNNLPELEKAIVLLNEALDHVKKAGSGVFYVVEVQSFLAATHLLIAESKCRKLVGYESWPLPEQLTPEFFVMSNCHTIQQVREYLDHNGTSPIESFICSHFHYRVCAHMVTKHLDSLKHYSENWVHSIEKQKELYVKLQNVLSVALCFHMKRRDVLSKLTNLPTEEVERSEGEYIELVANMVPEALLWSERGRARFLEMQLNRRVQQQQEIFREPNYKELHAFDMDDEGAWKVIRSSLDACGEGTVFLEYSFEGETARTSGEKTLGRVYGVKKAGGKILEPLLMRSLPGDPSELQFVIEHLHKSMDPESLLKYNQEEVTRDLEKLYMFLITPHVAEFLKGMHHDHKLVICPSQIFTKVPFAALRNPAEQCRTKGYMFQSHTISITPSLRVLKYNEERYGDLKNMKLMEGSGASIAMGNPRYADTSKWPSLPDSGAEVESIASMFPNRCESLQYMDATVEKLVDRVKLPSQRSRSQAFVHIAAHCLADNVAYKQGILKLTDPDQTDMPSSSSTPPVRIDGILSAENVVQSEIEWRTHMVVLSACGSGKGEIKAEGVLNLARALMVAGVPCSVVSQWKVEDASTRRLMEHFYQHMLKGVDVATALRSSMLEMLDKESSIKQWAPFMVWGLPTVCLPDELLVSGDAGIVLLKSGKELIESNRYSDAILPLKKSLELLKAKTNRTEEESNALVRCLWCLVECEESSYRSAQVKEEECQLFPIPLKILKYATKSHLDDLKADQFRHLDSAIQYLSEALEYAKDDGFSVDPPTQQVVHKRLGQIHQFRGMLCYVQIQDKPLPSDMITNGIQAVLDYYRDKDISGEESWRKAFEHLIECAKLSSRDMSRSAKDSDPWNGAATLSNMLILDMKEILCWRQGYLQLIKQKLTDCHIERLTSDDELAVPLSYAQEFRTLILSRIAEKEIWLNRMYTPECEELSLGWRTVSIDDVTWDRFKLDSWKETLTLAESGCTGIDVVVEYVVDDSDSSPQKFLLISVLSQDLPPRIFVNEVNMNRLKSTMSSHSNPKSGSFIKDLEYLHEVLIKPILEDPTINTMRNHQTIVFIPCKVLEGVPFALLRDGAQPDGEGYVIQSHTISTVPSFRILERCSQCRQDLQWLPLMPEASDSSLVLTNPAIPMEKMEAGGLGPALIVASQFPTQCKALYGSNSTAESLLNWANLPSFLINVYCQAFFHFEAEFGEGIAEAVENFGRYEWSVRMAVVRACQYTDIGQINKETVLRLVKEFLMRGVPCAVMSNYLVDDVSSDVFFTHLYTNLKNGEGVAAAFRYSVLAMKNEGFDLDQWGAFYVSGDPTVRLPQEMLRSNQELLQSQFYSDLLIFPSS